MNRSRDIGVRPLLKSLKCACLVSTYDSLPVCYRDIARPSISIHYDTFVNKKVCFEAVKPLRTRLENICITHSTSRATEAPPNYVLSHKVALLHLSCTHIFEVYGDGTVRC